PVGQAFSLPPNDKAGSQPAPLAGGKVRILRTPPLTAADNRIEQTTQIQVQPDGTALCRRSVTYQGQAAVRRRDDWTETPPGERRRLVMADVPDAHRNLRILAHFLAV